MRSIPYDVAERLADGRETSPEILMAISRVLRTTDETAIVAEWENGYESDAVIAEARRLRTDATEPLFWGAEGRVA